MAASGGSWQSGNFQASASSPGMKRLKSQAEGLSIRRVPANSLASRRGYAYEARGERAQMFARTLPEMRWMLEHRS